MLGSPGFVGSSLSVESGPMFICELSLSRSFTKLRASVLIVVPTLSILAEPPVAVVEKVARRRGTSALAQAYLEFLYTDEAQDLAGKHFYRPRKQEILAKYSSKLPTLPLVTVDKDFGGWAKAQKEHFDDGGTFDQAYGAQ